ncbi:hypothetical protein OPV22_029630 [Ensete ventricosum]|uniref:Uncharacterized protein n=1 Tax=Ensete ventricosum TaxID=4639 RepID=A0AAV8Q1S6_ENSVE|nr:hypothetical protein OPV22_029630 [Ensete ventricosum]RWW28026.1 hypothetical protein GW17_00007525 [Ensete ventricosum]RWW59356.1 hypothetical protein BHE74_00033710 [Ensete ventricosum]RZS09779.1 hypothetical protein BHM03_00040899 [Ensete ventricosum]
MAASPASSAPPPPPPFAAKKGFLRRVLPFLLTANLAVGGYVLLRTSKKESTEKDEEAVGEVPASPVVTIKPVIPDKKQVVGPIPAPLKVLPPIAEQEQRELFQWILEEKRKMKPGDRAERKEIDEEKALLKQFIRAKSIPII